MEKVEPRMDTTAEGRGWLAKGKTATNAVRGNQHELDLGFQTLENEPRMVSRHWKRAGDSSQPVNA